MNEYAIGIYSDYTENGYIVIAGNEVSKSENNELTTKIISAGKYAKFSIHRHMQETAAKDYIEFICDQIRRVGDIRYKKRSKHENN